MAEQTNDGNIVGFGQSNPITFIFLGRASLDGNFAARSFPSCFVQ